MRYRVLALCAGYGGLERAVTAGLDGHVVAFAESDPYAATVFSAHHPGVPNLGDITAVDWRGVLETHRPDVITAGWPCTNISNAGDRSGIDGEHSRIWRNVAEAIGVVRPRIVFMENVAVLTRRGLPRVLGDLAGYGYDARWTCLRASETVGAPHERYRWFGIAYPTAENPDLPAWNEWGTTAAGEAEGGRTRPDAGRRVGVSLPTPTARDWKSGASNLMDVNARPLNEFVVNLLPTPKASDGPHGGPNQRDTSGNYYLPGLAVRLDGQSWLATNGKDYGPAVRRWEHVTGRAAPCPTEPGTRGNRRLSPVFEEWMMGLPDGWVTGVPDIPRKEQMRMLGNGVVWQQGHHAYTYLLTSDDFRIKGQDDMSTETETKAERPKGDCTGCGFGYTLSVARSGEFKGESVTRKHNSRTGPGLCSGAQRPPMSAEPVVVCGHPDGFGFADDENGHSGSFCVTCGDPEPEHTTDCALLGPEHCAPGKCAGCCGCSSECTGTPCAGARQITINSAPEPEPPITISEVHAENPPRTASEPAPVLPQQLTDPAPTPSQLPPVSGQPEPDRDRWGRYMVLGSPHTRATTFAKLGSSTFALGEWNERMLIKGLVERRDLLAMAHGLDVKRDRATLNKIADDAQAHAGNKVAANIGTAYHAFTERLDAGLITLSEVPPEYRARCEQYVTALRRYGLTTRPEWIERTTAVNAEQVSAPIGVAGTLDRIFQLPNGELVIGDLKTGSDLSYGWVEIAVQLALYAHGVNTHGLFDWNSKAWQTLEQSLQTTGLTVRTDYAIVMHLPADGDGCDLYRVDLVKGWEYAQVSGLVQSRQKDKSVAAPLTTLETGLLRSPEGMAATGRLSGDLTVPTNLGTDPSHLVQAADLITGEHNPLKLMEIYAFAEQSGRFTADDLAYVKSMCAERWAELNIAY